MKHIFGVLVLLLVACSDTRAVPPAVNQEATAEVTPDRNSEQPKEVKYQGSNRDRFEAFALINLPADCIPKGYEQRQRHDEDGNNLLGWTDDLETDEGEAFTVGLVERRCFELLKPRLLEQTRPGNTELFGEEVREVKVFPDADGGPTFMIYFGTPVPRTK